ncbi:MAG: hypothetical protein Tsb002_11690 [Wenzhouxiangellaceae bacterium]
MSNARDDQDSKAATEALIKDTFRHLLKLAMRENITVKRMGQLLPRVQVQLLHEQGMSKTAIASLTGYSRKTVSQYLAEQQPRDNTNPVDRFVNHWAADPDFPDTLAMNGPGPSFLELFDRYGGDLTPMVMLDRLVEQSVVRREENQITLLSRTVTARSRQEKVEGIQAAINAHFTTLIHNYDSNDEPFLERRLWSDAIPKSRLGMLRDKIREINQMHRNDILTLLDQFETEPSDFETEMSPIVGLGMYWFESEA